MRAIRQNSTTSNIPPVFISGSEGGILVRADDGY